MKTLITHGTIVTATDTYEADLYVDGETISAIGKDLKLPADRTIDARGKYLIPGGIDVHTHLDMPFGGAASVDDFRTGTIAAAHGGTTSIVDFAIQERGHSLREAWDAALARTPAAGHESEALPPMHRNSADHSFPSRYRVRRDVRPRRFAFKVPIAPGLFLVVKPNGQRSWRHVYRFGGRTRYLNLGSYPYLSIGRARDVHNAARGFLARGLDPAAHRPQLYAVRRRSARSRSAPC